MSRAIDACPTCGGAVELDAEQERIADALDERELLEPITAIIRDHHVLMGEAFGRGRTASVAAARHACWAFLRVHGFSYPEIGTLWNVHHTTVMSGTKSKRSRAC